MSAVIIVITNSKVSHARPLYSSFSETQTETQNGPSLIFTKHTTAHH